MENLDYSKIPEYALGAGMVTAIGYILLQLIRSYGSLGGKWEKYAEELEKREEKKDKKIAHLEKRLEKKRKR